MKRFAFEDHEVVKIAIQQEISRSAEARYDHRLHGLLLLSHGKNSYEVAELLGHSPRTIQYWFRRFQESGFAGLMDEEGQGRSSRLTVDMMKRLDRDIRQSPETFGYSQGYWDGILLSHHINSVYGVEMGVRQCQRLFHKMGFRRRKPRGVIAGGDPAEREAYKKTP